MKATFISFILLNFFSQVEASFRQDSIQFDSLKLSQDIKLDNSRTYKTYYSNDTWFRSGYNNTFSNVIGRAGIMNNSDYSPHYLAPSLSYRGLGPTIVVLNSVPLNTFDILTDNSIGTQLNTQFDYISSLELQNASVVKGNKLSSIYGGHAISGAMFFNNLKTNRQGLNVSFNSSYSNIKERSGNSSLGILREGISAGYEADKIASNFVVEYMHSNTKDTPESKVNAFYLSNSSTVQITKKLSASTYLNKYHNKINVDGNSGDLNNDRLILGIGLNYKLMDFLSLNSGFSVLDLSQTFERKVFNAVSAELETENIKWSQKYFYAQVNFSSKISGFLGTNLNLGFRKLDKSKKLEALAGDIEYKADFENDLDYLYGNLSLDFKELIFVGYSINREKNSQLPAEYDITNYRTLYSSFVFSKIIKSTPFLTSGLIRMNYSAIGDHIDQYELGMELRLLKNYIGTSITYYNSKEELISQAVSVGSGNRTANALELELSGIELEIYAQPLPFWSISLNWANFNSDINGGNNSSTSGLGAVIDGIDPILIGGTNFPVGNPNPKWNATLYNNFTFSNLSFGLLLSYRKGGDVFSFSLPAGRVGIPNTTILDASGLVLRNIYLNYSFKDVLKLDQIQIGISAQNLFAKTNLPDDEIPQDVGVASAFRQNSKSFGINLKVDF